MPSNLNFADIKELRICKKAVVSMLNSFLPAPVKVDKDKVLG